MDFYKEYPAHIVFFAPYLCRCGGRAGAAGHVVLERPRPFYSYLHRVWSKTSDKPVGWSRLKSHLRFLLIANKSPKPLISAAFCS